MEQKISHIVCKNIFKGERRESQRAEFTKLWIELINQFEKEKELIFYEKQLTS